MPKTAPPKSVRLLLPSPTASGSSSAPIPSRKVLKAAAAMAKSKRQVLDVVSFEAESSRSGRRGKSSSKRSSKGQKELGEAEPIEAEGTKEQSDREKSEASAGYWNHLLIEARRSRGPQWDFSTQIYLVDRGSHLYYSQSHLPERPVASETAASQPQQAQAAQPAQTYPPQSQPYPPANYSAAQQQLAQQAHLNQQRQQAIAAQQQLSQMPSQPPAGFPNMGPDQVAMYRQQFLQQQQQQALAMQMNGGPPRGSPQSQSQYYPSPPAGGNAMYTQSPLRPSQGLPTQMQQGMRPGGMSGMMLGGQQGWQQGQGR